MKKLIEEKESTSSKPEGDTIEPEQPTENSDDPNVCKLDADGKVVEWIRNTDKQVRGICGPQDGASANRPAQGEHSFLHELLHDKLRNSSAEAQARFHSDTNAVRVQAVPYFGFILILEETLPRVRHGEQVDAFGFVDSAGVPVAIEEMFGEKALEEIREEIRQ